MKECVDVKTYNKGKTWLLIDLYWPRQKDGFQGRY